MLRSFRALGPCRGRKLGSCRVVQRMRVSAHRQTGRGPREIVAARALIQRLQAVYDRTVGCRARISTANAQSRHDAEPLGGPYAEFLREPRHS